MFPLTLFIIFAMSMGLWNGLKIWRKPMLSAYQKRLLSFAPFMAAASFLILLIVTLSSYNESFDEFIPRMIVILSPCLAIAGAHFFLFASDIATAQKLIPRPAGKLAQFIPKDTPLTTRILGAGLFLWGTYEFVKYAF